jgi:hypothetical protein
VGHLADEFPLGEIQTWPAGSTPLALAFPEGSKAASMPANHRIGLHDDQRSFPIGQQSSQENPDGSVTILQAWAFLLAAENLELVTESDILQNQRSAGLKDRSNQA